MGHSNHPLERLLATLESASIRHVVDVRRIPSSRRNPHFSRTSLERVLPARGILYSHAEALGGKREPRPDSPNRGLREAWATGYADYMATTGFRAALGDLVETARREPVAILCAEADPGRCHRSLVADALTLAGVSVVHLIAPGETREHAPHSALRRSSDGTPIYPDAPGLFP